MNIDQKTMYDEVISTIIRGEDATAQVVEIVGAKLDELTLAAGVDLESFKRFQQSRQNGEPLPQS